MSKQKLFIVIGGELVDPSVNEFRDPTKIEVTGVYTTPEDAKDAWKARAFGTVDNALMRFFVLPLSDLIPDLAAIAKSNAENIAWDKQRESMFGAWAAKK